MSTGSQSGWACYTEEQLLAAYRACTGPWKNNTPQKGIKDELYERGIKNPDEYLVSRMHIVLGGWLDPAG